MSGGRASKSNRAGLVFPVTRTHRYLRKKRGHATRVTESAAVYLASSLEYLVREVMELSGSAARFQNATRVNPRHIMMSIKCDLELNQLAKGVILPGTGVLLSLGDKEELKREEDSVKLSFV